MDIERLKMQGIKFSKEWTVEDSVEDMQYEMRRHMLHIDEMNNINMMRDGLRMMCTGIEMLNWTFRHLGAQRLGLRGLQRHESVRLGAGEALPQVLAQIVQHDARDGDRERAGHVR